MAQRIAIINPGSARWWLLSLSPVLFYDRIEIDPKGIEDVLNQGDLSSFHERAARTLELILKNSDEKILYENNQLPQRGKTEELKEKSEEITDRLISEASNYSLEDHPTLIKPDELKEALKTAYQQWISYNQLKASILQKNEPLSNLLGKKIQQSEATLKKINETPANRIPELLDKDNQLKTVLRELVRNALLIMDLAKDSTKRVYDSLVDEFLPTIELVERVRIFRELPEATHEELNFILLTQLYNFSLSKIKSSSIERPDVIEAFMRALKERKRLSDLRSKIAEFDVLINVLVNEQNLKPDQALRSISALIKDINITIKRIDAAGTWAVWGVGTYVLGEILSSSSPIVRLLLQTILLNPLTVETIKKFVQNYYIALSGLSPKSSSYISIIKDHIAFQLYSHERHERKIYNVRPNIFEFWV
jgi:hypothetical protein